MEKAPDKFLTRVCNRHITINLKKAFQSCLELWKFWPEHFYCSRRRRKLWHISSYTPSNPLFPMEDTWHSTDSSVDLEKNEESTSQGHIRERIITTTLGGSNSPSSCSYWPKITSGLSLERWHEIYEKHHKRFWKHRKNCECCPVSLLILRSQKIVIISGSLL